MIGRFFHTPGTKQFTFKPRFYDPDREEREERERRIKKELGIVEEKKDDGKPFRANIKGQFRNTDGWQSRSSESARRAQNRRLIWIIMILALVMYLFFWSDLTF
jgi:hypothetical protein